MISIAKINIIFKKMKGQGLIKVLSIFFVLFTTCMAQDCLILFRPEFKAYISDVIKPGSRVLIVIHGGLSSAEKSYNMCKRFVSEFPKDVTVISLDYSPSTFGGKEVTEAVALIKWLKTQNVKEIGVLGKSHGAYIALKAASKTNVDYVISISAPTELEGMLSYVNKEPDKFKIWKKVIDTTKAQCKSKEKQCLRKLSVVSSVKGLMNENVLIIHGTKDSTVPLTQAVELINAFIKAGKSNFTALFIPSTHKINIFDPFIKDFIFHFIGLKEKQENGVH